MRYAVMSVLGYLSGSIMYAYLIPKIFLNKDIREESEDGNPGTANVFLNAGAKWGILVLFFEIAKGFLPIAVGTKFLNPSSIYFAFVLAAPVIGHAFPILFRARGGKAIAVSFGVLLGLWPYREPVMILAFFYLFFSVILVINPHFYRSVITFFCFGFVCVRQIPQKGIVIGCIGIALIVIWKHYVKYHGEKLKVMFLMHKRMEERRDTDMTG